MKLKFGVENFKDHIFNNNKSYEVRFPTLKQMKRHPEIFGEIIEQRGQVKLSDQFILNNHLGNSYVLNFENGIVLIPDRFLGDSWVGQYTPEVLKYVKVKKFWERT